MEEKKPDKPSLEMVIWEKPTRATKIERPNKDDASNTVVSNGMQGYYPVESVVTELRGPSTSRNQNRNARELQEEVQRLEDVFQTGIKYCLIRKATVISHPPRAPEISQEDLRRAQSTPLPVTQGVQEIRIPAVTQAVVSKPMRTRYIRKDVRERAEARLKLRFRIPENLELSDTDSDCSGNTG